MMALVAVARRVVVGGLVFRDLADDFAGEPGEVVCGAARIAVIGQLRRFQLEFEVFIFPLATSFPNTSAVKD